MATLFDATRASVHSRDAARCRYVKSTWFGTRRQAVVLRRDRFFDLQHEIRVRPDVVSGGDDCGAVGHVGVVIDGRPHSGPGFDERPGVRSK